MLDRAHRITRGSDFVEVVKRGRRAGSRTLVVYAGRTVTVGREARAGLVVGRAVGNAVTRNRVKRRLRHLLSAQLDGLGGVDLVVRALPAAAGSSSPDLERDLVPLIAKVRPGR